MGLEGKGMGWKGKGQRDGGKVEQSIVDLSSDLDNISLLVYILQLLQNLEREVCCNIFRCVADVVVVMCAVALWTFMWFVCFCFTLDAWRRTGVRKHSDAANAVIVFSFFSIAVFVSHSHSLSLCSSPSLSL